jgi:3-oxoacyl-[acyl-carrier protein] reductase
MPTTLVTGASRGIGAVICNYLAAHGHNIIGVARQRPEDFNGKFYAADLANEQEVDEVFAKIMTENEIDGLVNNAGRASRAKLEDVDLSELRDMFTLNVQALVQCTKLVVPQMRERGKGRIVNMASRALLGRNRTSVYAATKAAVQALTRSWAIELAEGGITVNAVAPGIVQSEMFLRNNPPNDPETLRLLQSIPMHRPGNSMEVAPAVAYFLSEGASYTTGQTLFVCGGWSL